MIHDSAIVDPSAELGENVSVGPFTVIGPSVRIGDNSSVGSHVIMEGETTLGQNNRIYDFACLGCEPQHTGYGGENTALSIGDNNVIREYATISRGTLAGGGITRIRDNNFLMAYTHVAHDCDIGSQVIFANGASLAGHVSVGDYVVLGGFTGVHQFCRVGAHCITGIGAVCIQDVPPYVLAAGHKAVAHGINIKGLRKRDFKDVDIGELKRAYKVIYRSGYSIGEATQRLECSDWSSKHVHHMIEFLKTSERGIIS